jgi:hypothetical protein
MSDKKIKIKVIDATTQNPEIAVEERIVEISLGQTKAILSYFSGDIDTEDLLQSFDTDYYALPADVLDGLLDILIKSYSQYNNMPLDFDDDGRPNKDQLHKLNFLVLSIASDIILYLLNAHQL